MAVKIRLARHGKKGYAFFHIVVADSRAPRDGRMIEKLGTYNPNTNPATIELNFESALKWLKNGAQPTDTANAVLSYEGVLLKKHLDEGVKKGAFSAEVAQERLNAWLVERNRKIEAKKEGLAKQSQRKAQERIDAESKTKAAKAEIVSAKRRAAAESSAKAESKSKESADEDAATPQQSDSQS
jgi:small subunit ribosomal protein S16